MTTTIDRTMPATGIWAIDPAHSTIGFSARHLMAAKVRGSFTSATGTITVGDTPETSTVDVSIDAASVDTGVGDRDNHLRSPDFLDVEQFPTLVFTSTEVAPTVEGYMLTGDLTIKGITHQVMLSMQYLGLVTDPWGQEKALFSAATTINREDWGLTWNQALDAGGWLVGKKVDIELEIQAASAAPIA